MNKLILLVSFCLFNVYHVVGKYTIYGQFTGQDETVNRVVLSAYIKGVVPIQSADVVNNSFSLLLELPLPQGVYRLSLGNYQSSTYIDFILNDVDTNLHLDLNLKAGVLYPTFSNSEENVLWHQYQSTFIQRQLEINILGNYLLVSTDSKSSFYDACKSHINKIITAHNTDKQELQKNSATYYWIPKLVGFQKLEAPILESNYRLSAFYQRDRYWTDLKIYDDALINSPIYGDLIFEYISFYMNPKMDFSIQEIDQGFKKCMDTILQKFSATTTLQQFAYDYLSDGFNAMGRTDLVQYLESKFKNNVYQCKVDGEKEPESESFKIRVEQQVPNIYFVYGADTVGNLYSLAAENTLLVFWTSTCEHCIKQLPALNEIATKYRNLQVVSISLDENIQDHAAAIEQYGLNKMRHYADYKGYNSILADQFEISGTPTILLLDRNKKFIRPFLEASELSQYLSAQ